MRTQPLLLLFAFSAAAEVKTLTLRQALDLALAQGPDLMMARLDQQKARKQVIVTRDPFVPKVFAGSGAAWTTGFPNSIEAAQNTVGWSTLTPEIDALQGEHAQFFAQQF